VSRRVVVALGGNAILQPGQKGSANEQMENVNATAAQIVEMIRSGYEVLVSHGNGPQVGAILIQNELGSSQVPAMPMDICGAESQGLIGYMLCQALENELVQESVEGRRPVCVVTRVQVDEFDSAFVNPTKPVGPFYTEEIAARRMAENNETWISDAGRGWRRVVPSPDPRAIVERDAIRDLMEKGYTVIASGGGGIPVVRNTDGSCHGVEAVIDKDLASERLAADAGADILMILTDVSGVALRYGKPDEETISTVKLDVMREYQKEGHFRAGSMGPKVEAALRFVENGGSRAVIAGLSEAVKALEGNAGTQIVK